MLHPRRQRPRRTHDKVCARGDNALGVHIMGSGRAHDKDVRATDLSSSKKKKALGIWGVTRRFIIIIIKLK